MADQQKEYERLRKMLNPSISGSNVDSILYSLAKGTGHLIDTVEAVNDQCFIVSASDRYLDMRLADKGLTRPTEVGLSDDIFRQIGLAVTNRKQVRDLIHDILAVIYGFDSAQATNTSSLSETYALKNGDTLIVSFDDQEDVEIVFDSNQFVDIFNATAQEVADAITKYLRRIGKKGLAIARDEGTGNKVILISETKGPSSSVTVKGGRANNLLKFGSIINTSGDVGTQWTLTQQSGGVIRATWTAGADPIVGKVSVGDYVNIYGLPFDLANRGSFTILKSQGGTIGNSYVEFQNDNGMPEIVTQTDPADVLFFQPKRESLLSKTLFTAAYQTSENLLQIFMPATTKVVRRGRIGSAHIYLDDTPATDGDFGPYIFDTSKPYVIGSTSTITTEVENSSSDSVIFVSDSSQFPDEQGFLVFGFGTSHEEGPVPYIAKPSNNSLLLDPSFVFTKKHPIGTDVSIIDQNSPIEINVDGSDYGFYITDVVSGRIYAEELINSIAAAGISLVFTIIYPNDVGLAKFGTATSDKTYVWGV